MSIHEIYFLCDHPNIFLFPYLTLKIIKRKNKLAICFCPTVSTVSIVLSVAIGSTVQYFPQCNMGYDESTI